MLWLPTLATGTKYIKKKKSNLEILKRKRNLVKVFVIKVKNQRFDLRFLSLLFLLCVTAISKWHKYMNFYVCLIHGKFRLSRILFFLERTKRLKENLNLRKVQEHQKPQVKKSSNWFGCTWRQRFWNKRKNINNLFAIFVVFVFIVRNSYFYRK